MELVAKSKKAKKSKRIIILIVTAIIVIISAIIASFIALVMHIDSSNTVFPNVWYEGIDMSGKSRAQVRQILIDSGYEERAAKISLTVSLPYDVSFSFNGDEAGLTPNADKAAQEIVSYGRLIDNEKGEKEKVSFIDKGFTYIDSFFNKVELDEMDFPDYDDSVMRRLTEQCADEFNSLLVESNTEFNDTYISILKGTTYAEVSAQELFLYTEREFKQAIEQRAHLEVPFLPEPYYGVEINLEEIYSEFYIEPVSSYYDPLLGDPDSEIYDTQFLGATECSDGRTFDLETAQLEFSNLPPGETMQIPIIVLEPEMTQDELFGMLYRDVLAETSASAPTSTANRKNNVDLAAAAIDGLVMQPGDVFSYNTIVGPRTTARGYKPAPAFVAGLKKDEVGGGICQVSSVIYYALIYTNLEIVNRQPHGMEVTYLDGGLDATVSYGTIDFRFKNNTDFPIKLEVKTTGSVTVSVRIYGTRTEELYYKVESEKLGTQEMDIIERDATDEDFATLAAMGVELKPQQTYVLRPGNAGTSYTVWRYPYSDPELTKPVLDNNGQPIKQKFKTDSYRMQPRVIVFNPEPLPPTPPPDVTDPGDGGGAEG